MALGIFAAIVIIILGIVGAVIANVVDNGAVKVIGVLLCIAMVFAFIAVPFSFHTVDTGEVAVVKHLGKAKEVKTAGTL